MSLKSPLNNKRNFQPSLEIISVTLFITIGFLAAFNHSLWRDEMQGWLVAWKSDTWVNLWKNNAPSGHPVLWSALIFLVKDFTKTPLSMQLMHWFLGSLSIICFWRWNPLPGWQKTLFTFGYFPFWEYYFVCRHYVLAQLITFLFCSSFPLRRRTYIPAALCIGLLVNTHAFSWSIGFAALVTLITEWVFSSKQRNLYLRNRFWIIDLSISLVIVLSLTGFASLSFFQVREAVDSVPTTLDLRHFLRVVGRVFGGYMLVIPNSKRFLDLFITLILTIGLVITTLSFLRRSRASTIFFISGTSFMFAFNYFLYLGIGSRHYGYYFLILIASIWLALHPGEEAELNSSQIYKDNQTFNVLSNFFPFLLTFSLSVHFAAGVHRALYDFYVPYSAGEATATYIKEKGWADLPKFGTRDVEITTVSGYLNRDIYYPEIKALGSYSQWNNRRSLKREDTLYHVKSYLSEHPNTPELLLILSRKSAFRELQPGDVMIQEGLRIVADQRFERSWVYPERYYLYWVENIKSEKLDMQSFPIQNRSW
ncbi:hypothetical protein [Prochlorococcus sp. MIT 1307]|uniref:hypothetical protein n=1 Tax=Prochlorococcus sp. MIT 1307 TaxID=3096219 RepID=UPI002A753B06|nr:hypothetical protein [Prochlorococcus sp. MIT 1307]